MSAGDWGGAPVPPPALIESLVEDVDEIVIVVGDDLAIAYTNATLERVLGYHPSEVIGHSALDYVHPDDVERAVESFATSAVVGVPDGTTSFRIRLADGTYRPYDVAGANVTDGERSFIALYCWAGDFQWGSEQVFVSLLESKPMDEVLTWVIDLFGWKVNGAHVAIAWMSDGEHHVVSTGLPAGLTGAEADPGAPWAEARRGTGVVLDGPDDLDPRRRELAVEAGRGSFWIEPVVGLPGGEPVLITVSSRAGGPSAHEHVYGMEVARTYVELVFRWTQQLRQLAAAASTDALTGLANRRALFDLIDREAVAGAVLFCDLDRFKAVNDEHGHHVGDEVLRVVADRLRGCVRTGDLVARAGGDEFVVIARDATEAEVDALADRIDAVVAQPIVVGAVTVDVGVSVGAGLVATRITEADLVAADQAQIATKQRRRARRG